MENRPINLNSLKQFLIISSLILWGPVCRAIVDKIWITHGSIEIIGQWAQLQSVADFIAAPAFLGTGYGLTVLISQNQKNLHYSLLVSSCILGWLTCCPMLIGAIFFSDQLTHLLSLDRQFVSPLILISLIGWLGISSGQLSSFWLGKEERWKILVFTLVTGLPGILILTMILMAKPSNPILYVLYAGICLAIAINLWIVFSLIKNYSKGVLSLPKIKKSLFSLAKYLPAGFSIGILTPVSTLIARSLIAQHLDWEAAGTATALWRASDWVLNCAQGVLYYYYLPKLSAQVIRGNFFGLIQKIATWILIPALIALLLLQIYRNPLLHWLYNEHVQFNWQMSALFWTGDFFRILAGIFLMGLYSLNASKSISIGEILSQPLFAFFLFMGISNTLELVGFYHLFTYVIYATFCLGMLYFISKNKKFN
jgi:hypothetical protein